MKTPFSFEEIASIPEFPLQKPSFLQASDGIRLAYYSFLPEKPSAIVAFYHGGGFYSSNIYQYIGQKLKRDYGIGSYFFDIRGHGNSEGPRGDAPSQEQVLKDVSSALAMVKAQFPHVPLFLAGHSSGAGLILNYSQFEQKMGNVYAGYILLAPYLGPRVGVERSDAPPFVKKVRLWIYLLNNLFKLPFFQHIPAVFFNYPEQLLKQDPLIVNQYSYTMSMATTPHNPKLIFEHLDKPCTLYIGQEDEQFDSEKVAQFAHYNKTNVNAEIVEGAKHLSILLNAPALIHDTIKHYELRPNH